MKEPRRFPAPWYADKTPGGYVVRDANKKALAYIYSRETDAEAMQAKVLTTEEARRVAANIARLPDTGAARTYLGIIHHTDGMEGFRRRCCEKAPSRLRCGLSLRLRTPGRR